MGSGRSRVLNNFYDFLKLSIFYLLLITLQLLKDSKQISNNLGAFFEQNEQTPWNDLKKNHLKGWEFMICYF